jgi:hypothetical protein
VDVVGQPQSGNRGGGRGVPGRLDAVRTHDALGTCAVRRATHTIEASLADVRTHVVGHLMCACRRAASRRKHVAAGAAPSCFEPIPALIGPARSRTCGSLPFRPTVPDGEVAGSPLSSCLARGIRGRMTASVDASRVRAYHDGSRDPILGVPSFGSALAP